MLVAVPGHPRFPLSAEADSPQRGSLWITVSKGTPILAIRRKPPGFIHRDIRRLAGTANRVVLLLRYIDAQSLFVALTCV